MENGNFIISLDFELHWGAAEKWDLSDKKGYFDATRQSIPQVLALFEAYGVHATWATVGFLFAKNRQQLLDFLPVQRPSYYNKELSYYRLIDTGQVGADEKEDPYHFAPSLIEQIIATPGQELATHTFAHYYCNEAGQTPDEFDADLKAVQAMSETNFGRSLISLVFPRNQFNPEYTGIAARNGIKVIRTNPDVWFWKSKAKAMALARAVDTLFPISRSLSFREVQRDSHGVLHLPASRFFRPYTDKEKTIRKRKNRRIMDEMTYAAKHGQSYHLWWHPHNFGDNPAQNMQDLEELLRHFRNLHHRYGFASRTMSEMNTK